MDEHDMWDGFFDETPAETEEPETEVEETEIDTVEETVVEDADSDIGGGDPTSTEEGAADTNVGTSDQDGQEAEMQARIAAEAQKRVDAAIAKQFAGIMNPLTGKPIKTEADLNAYREAYQAAEQRRKFEEMGVDEKMLNDFVNNHPAIIRANQLIQEQQQAQANDFMVKEFKGLMAEFPDCGMKDARELLNTAEGRKALQIWKNNDVSLADAYALTHGRRSRPGKQQQEPKRRKQ